VKVPPHLRVGACSHTGLVRSSNEDDYLLADLPGSGTFVAAIADGMGGLAGGAEASRTALRAAASSVLDGGRHAPLGERVRDGFAAAGLRVFDASQAVPALRDMGTTLTMLCLHDGQAVVGHVGDTRLYRVRGGQCEQLTTDHAVREPENLLTRCIGAGQSVVEADHAAWSLAAGDRFVLVSDGVWSVLTAAALARLAALETPQGAADALVGESLARGGPDNATAIVVDVMAPRGPAAVAPAVDTELPRDERVEAGWLWPRARSLRGPTWPWLLWLAGASLLAFAALRAFGVDVLG
jgi:serine/threonine protein phosphatase PrpC